MELFCSFFFSRFPLPYVEVWDCADLICITEVVKSGTKLETSACASVLPHGLQPLGEVSLCVFLSQIYCEWEKERNRPSVYMLASGMWQMSRVIWVCSDRAQTHQIRLLMHPRCSGDPIIQTSSGKWSHTRLPTFKNKMYYMRYAVVSYASQTVVEIQSTFTQALYRNKSLTILDWNIQFHATL